MKAIIYNKLKQVAALFDYTKIVDWDSYVRFERNYKQGFQNKHLTARLDYLHEWKDKIGFEVYCHRESFNYLEVSEYKAIDSKYFDNSYSTVFTDERYDQLERDYIQYQIQRLTEELTERNLIESSTNKLSNLMSEWQLECKQNLLKIFKNLLNEK